MDGSQDIGFGKRFAKLAEVSSQLLEEGKSVALGVIEVVKIVEGAVEKSVRRSKGWPRSHCGGPWVWM